LGEEKKSALPEKIWAKILATRMGKGPPPYVGMEPPRMVNPALTAYENYYPQNINTVGCQVQ